MSDSPFNVVFAEARIARNLSVRQVAERARFTDGFVRSYEEFAKNPTAKTLYKYARVLGLRFTIDKRGITITDEDTDVVFLEDWKPE